MTSLTASSTTGAAAVQSLFDKALASFGGPQQLRQSADAWRIALDYLTPTDQQKPAPSRRVIEAFQIVEAHKLGPSLLDEVLVLVDRKHSAELEPLMKNWKAIDTADGADELIQVLCSRVQAWASPLVAFGPGATSARRAFWTRIQTLFYAQVPLPFGTGLRNIYRQLLKEGSVESSPAALATIERLHRLALVDRYEPIVFQAAYEAIEDRVEASCRGAWGGEEGQLAALLKWVEDTVNAFLISVVRHCRLLDQAEQEQVAYERATQETKQLLRGVFQRFTFHVHQTLGNLRTSELFDIVVDHPDSKPALDDLKLCLAQTDRRSYAATQMIAQNQKRLLHPGADTKDIISHYIATIRCLRILDPQGVLLARVAAPVRQYLRQREDTIRCIMAALIDEQGELSTELEKEPHSANAPGGQMEGATHFGPPDDDYTDVNWIPDPVDAPADYRKNQAADIIQLLVSIYDTKDVFVKELQVLLAQRLLAIKGYDFEREVRNVEILKKRFGEASLTGCEVMLKDLADSKRVDALIHTDASAAPPVHPIVVSRLFWPPFATQKLKLPPRLADARARYHQLFVRRKPDKFLRWAPQLGAVSVKLELEDRTVELDVAPVQAAIAELFSERAEWHQGDLIERLTGKDSDASFVRNALFFWANQGVLKDEGDGRWRLLERAEAGSTVQHVIDESQIGVESVQQQQAEQLRVFWSYIQGMLRNLGALPVERIHSMLGRFLPDYSSGGHTEVDLTHFLQAMERENVVEQQGNRTWKLVT